MKRVHLIKCAVAVMLLSIFNNVGASAQFYTVNFVSQTSDTLSLSADPYDGPFADAKTVQASAKGTCSDFAERSQFSQFSIAKVVTENSASKSLQEKSKKSGEKSFPSSKKRSAKLLEISLSDTTDSLILEHIKKRLTVCMPMDLMRVNSRYGYRKDPFKKCQKFHDGIDLDGVNELVFSMLPGKVYRVGHGNTGYGNFVELDHGNIRCLYGHLSMTMVNEGLLLTQEQL